MAYAKKTKTTDVVTDIKETTENTTSTTTTTTKSKKKTYADSDYILCRSVWFGGLNVTCPSGNAYEFAGYDSVCDINYRDLVSLIRRGSDHVFLPRFIILDDDFLVDYPTIKEVYKTMYTTSDLLDIVNLPNAKMRAEIEKLPKESKDVLCKMIATEIAKGNIDSISKVRMLSEIFDSDFDLISRLFAN